MCCTTAERGEKFAKIDHGCYERDGEGKPSMVEMTLTRPVPTGLIAQQSSDP
jgi:hypothetical protein